MQAPSAKDPSSSAILARLQDVFRLELDDDSLVLNSAARQVDLKGWDSLAHVRLITAVEAQFDIQLDLAEIENINSVRLFVETIQKHLETQQA